MSSVSGIGGQGKYWPDEEITQKQDELDLSDISILYTTGKVEEQRGTFSQTYESTATDAAGDGEKFLSSLIDNKEALQSDLGLSDTEYDNLACVALALASQETGMGFESGYKSENTGIGKFFRSIGKWFDVTFFGGKSASSGLTQMKIYDFMNDNNLTDEQKEILNSYGIEVKGYTKNNLYSEPDKSAVATMVVLKSIADNYENYTSTVSSEHEAIGQRLNDENAEAKGQEILDNIINIYNNSDAKTKSEIRSGVKSWLLAENGSTLDDRGKKKYNEEYQLNQLNDVLGSELTLTQSDLDYIRYALTTESSSFSVSEYCAYAWNKGTTDTGMQLDRILSEKVGTLLTTPEEFDYDQYTANVSALAKKYAHQALQ